MRVIWSMLSRGKFEVGELVSWYESYADCSDIVKDSGHGFVIDEYYCNAFDKPIEMYVVYRIKYQDTMKFEKYELEKVSEKS